ncbi:MAG: dihydrodipicolinate synthetase [Chitinophagaceae bacterium]|nr:MAG: dihydrodipicolinate synthetase [Chitinophagaceae bacterium]
MKYKHLEGLIAAPFTPMNADGSVNLKIIGDYYALLKRNKVSGAFINGSTGEGVSQTMEEKKSVCKAWADATKGQNFPVITLTGGTCIQDSIELAQYAQKVGLYGLALTAPYYFKPADIKQLAQCCVEVGNAVPELPFYYYHIPVLNGTSFPMISLVKELDNKLPSFAGIKYTHEDFMDFSSCLNFANGKYDMLWGRDENFLSAWVLGAKGAVGSTYNYAAPLYNDLMAAYERDDLKSARALQQKAIDMIELLGKYGGIATGKAYMKLIGLDCGEFRLPVKNMNKEQFGQFKKDAEALGFDHFRSV